MTDAETKEAQRGRWVWAVISGLSLAAALTVATTLGWTNGPVGAGLLIASAVVTLVIAVIGNHLPTPSKRQTLLASVTMITVFAVVLSAAWIWGRPSPPLLKLGPPSQRTLAELSSDCAAPNTVDLTGQGTSRIEATRVAAASPKGGDFIAALVSDVGSDPVTATVRLLLLECSDSHWQQVKSTTFPRSACGYELLTTQLRNAGQEEVVLTGSCGSGAFLEVRVFGAAADGSVKTLHAEDGLFQGRISQVSDKLLIESGGQRAELKWTEDGFERIDVGGTMTASEGVIIDFWWKSDGGHSDLSEIPARPGERIYFHWDRARHNEGSISSYRILASLPTCENRAKKCPAEFADNEQGERYLVLFQDGLKVEVTIIPNGYDWDQAIVLSVGS